MANNSPAPGAYDTGPPAAPHDKHKAPPSEPEHEQVPGYYNGPAAKAGAGDGLGSSAVAAKESGFFASCCACFSGGQTAK